MRCQCSDLKKIKIRPAAANGTHLSSILLTPGAIGVELDAGRPEACALWDAVANATEFVRAAAGQL